MRRTAAILGSFCFFLLAPGTVAGIVPWWISGWQIRPPLLGIPGMRAVGAGLMILGAPLLLDSFARFAIQGLGTPAPIFPTQHLVVTGFYRYVRNPMYLGATAVIAGQGLLLGNLRVLGYGVIAWMASCLFVMGYEEPKLRETFGDEYAEFRRNVPRWVPRLRPWAGALDRTG